MKKTFRLITLLLAVILIAISLCSCRALDDARNKQAFYRDSKNEIIWLNQTYKVLHAGDFSIISTDNREICVTASDVPVLLSGLEGDYGNIKRDDDSVISVYGKDYILVDKYENVKKEIESSALDHYYISYYPDSYYSYNSPDELYDLNYWNVGNQSNVLLEQDVTDVINSSIKVDDKDKVKLSEDSLKSAKALTVCPCDSNMMVTNYNMDNIVLLSNGEDYYAWINQSWDYTEKDEYSVYPFEKDGAGLIKALFEKYPEAVDQTAF